MSNSESSAKQRAFDKVVATCLDAFKEHGAEAMRFGPQGQIGIAVNPASGIMQLTSYLNIVRNGNDCLVTDLQIVSTLLYAGCSALNQLRDGASTEAGEPESPAEPVQEESGSGLILPVSVAANGRLLLPGGGLSEGVSGRANPELPAAANE